MSDLARYLKYQTAKRIQENRNGADLERGNVHCLELRVVIQESEFRQRSVSPSQQFFERERKGGQGEELKEMQSAFNLDVC